MWKTNKNLLFLDIDGVLNSQAWFSKNIDVIKSDPSNSFHHLDPEACLCLQQALNQVGNVSIVLSSTWRLLHTPEQMSDWFLTNGLTCPLIGYTPYLGLPDELKDQHSFIKRGLEIQWWLRNFACANGEVFPDISVAILDDDADMGDLLPCLTQTRFQTGFAELEVPYLLQKFNVTLLDSRAAGGNGEIRWEHDALSMEVNSRYPCWCNN